MPVGVKVSTTTRSAPSVFQQADAATYFLVGQAERGRTDKAQKVTSLGDYQRLYGGRVTYGALHDDVQTFFEEGGGSAQIVRVVGPAATLATKTLVDRAGSPVSTLRIDALGAGIWGASVTYAVVAGTISGTFQIQVSYSGTGAQVPEIYDNLVTPADAVVALKRSAYVRGTDLGSATAAPNNQPALQAFTPLIGGADDRASIVTGTYTAGLTLFGKNLGAGIVSCPGQPASVMGPALAAHGALNRRLVATTTTAAQTLNQAIAAEQALQAAVTSGQEFVGLFWPWIVIPDGAGGTRTITPEGYVAAKRALAHESEGPARPGAGSISAARFVVDTEQALTSDQVDQLVDSNVNPIRTIASNAIEIYGWSSISTDEVNYALLTQRDVLNYIAVALETELEPFTFRTIDGKGYLFQQINAVCVGVLEPLRLAGQLFEKIDGAGNLLDPGYRVDTGPSVNTALTEQANQANVNVSVRPSPAGQLVNVAIAKVALTGSV